MKRKIEYEQEMIDSDESLNIYGWLTHHHEVTIGGVGIEDPMVRLHPALWLYGGNSLVSLTPVNVFKCRQSPR